MKLLFASITIVLAALLLSVSFGQDNSIAFEEDASDSPATSAKSDELAPEIDSDQPAPSVTPAIPQGPLSDVAADSLPSKRPPGIQPSEADPAAAGSPIPFRAVMYVIEADWSKANNPEQVMIDIKTAFKELRFPHAEYENQLFTRAPEILFGPTSVSYYSPEHARSMIRWLGRYGLIKARYASTPAKIKTNECGAYDNEPDGTAKPPITFMKPGDIGLVIRDRDDAIPIFPPASLNLGELSHRAFRQVWWFQLNHREGMPVVDTKLFFEKKLGESADHPPESVPSMVMEEWTSMDVLDLPSDQVIFVNALTKPRKPNGIDANRRLTREGRFEQAARKGVIAVIAIARGFEVRDTEPELRLPDRVDVMRNVSEYAFSKVQLAPIETPSRMPLFRVVGRAPSDNEESVAPQSKRIEPSTMTNTELVGGTLEVVRKRYLEAEAHTIALAQKQLTEAVDSEIFVKAVSDAFALRQEVHRLELEQLRARADVMDQKLRARDAQKEQIIERRVQELLKLGKDWHSAKPADAVSSEQPPSVDSKTTAQSEVQRKLKERVEQRIREELKIIQSVNEPTDGERRMRPGTVIDMSDKRRWLRPSPSLADDDESVAKFDAQDRIESNKRQSVENLQKLMRAMLDFEKEHGRLPPAAIETAVPGKGPVRHSWRVAILPYLGMKELYEAYKKDEPWDSPNNLTVLKQMPRVFASPLDDANSTNSSYFGMITPNLRPSVGEDPIDRAPSNSGIGTAPPPVNEEQYVDGTVFSNPKGTRLEMITDGAARTIALIEAMQNIPWTQPLDLDINLDPESKLEKSWYRDGWHVAYVDGSVRQLSVENRINDLWPLFRINDNDRMEPKLIIPGVKRSPVSPDPPATPAPTLPLY